MIIELVKHYLDSNENWNKDVRLLTYHMSNVAICGYKYRWELENGIKYPYSWKYMIGNAFENSFMYYLSKEMEIERQKEITFLHNGNTYKGHVDAYLPSLDMILELKATNSPIPKDIYYRQIKAYMIAGNIPNGRLIIYDYIHNKMYENPVHVNKNDIELFTNNITAFENNDYVLGIENYLCQYCCNTDCIMHGKVVKQ